MAENNLLRGAFFSAIDFLVAHGQVRERDNRTEVFVTGTDGVEMSIPSNFNMNALKALSEIGGREMERIILGDASCVRIFSEDEEETFLLRSDSGRWAPVPEKPDELGGSLIGEVHYVIKGKLTAEEVSERIKGLVGI